MWDLDSEDYSFSGKFYEYTYTFYQFRPNSDGELRVRIDASEVNGNTTTLYYTLYDSDDDEALSVNLGEYSSWETTRRISNLDTSETYYIKFHKPDDGYRQQGQYPIRNIRKKLYEQILMSSIAAHEDFFQSQSCF